MPPELEPILKDPGVIEAMVAVVIAVLTAVAALLGFGVKRLRDLQKLSTESSEQVAVTKEQVTDSHGFEDLGDGWFPSDGSPVWCIA